MVQLESAGDLPQSGREIIRGCVGRISYTRESKGPFTGFGGIGLDCSVCVIVSAGLGEYVGIMSVPLPEEKMPQKTRDFLNSFCGIARGVINPTTLRRRSRPDNFDPAEVQVPTTPLDAFLLEKLGLTPLPAEVLTRLLQGHGTTQIHQEMGLKIGTVYRYLSRLRDAFEVQTTPQVITKAFQLGFKANDPKGDKLEGQ